MKPYYEDDSVTLYQGDCLEVMSGLLANSVDSIVTDPPYGLGFMGKAWDALPPGEDWARECLRVLKPGGHLLAFGGTRTWHRLAVAVEDAGFDIRDSIAWLHPQGMPKEGALKPAFEPVVMARRPLIGTRAANVAAFGTGKLNGDACRIGTEGGRTTHTKSSGADRDRWTGNTSSGEVTYPGGRWPTNVALHEASTKPLGDAAKYFYVAKPSKKERPSVDGTSHPTVKPLALMQWLVRLVTPAGGTVLDPFAGSGTTVEASILEGFGCIAIEREAEYLPLIVHRIDRQEGLIA